MDLSSFLDLFFELILPVLFWLLLIWIAVSWIFRRWESRLAAQKSSSLSFPISPMVFMNRRILVESLVNDVVIQDAIGEWAEDTGQNPADIEKRVRHHAREIVPAFKAIFYFTIGYWMARALLLGMYRVKVVRSARDVHAKIGRDATVVMIMNHRSNMDVLLVNFLLARYSTVAHSAGEWARLWPLHHLLRMAGNYVIDRDADDPLYRLVLKRFVQMAVTHGIHLGVFPEGSLSRDGNIQSLHFGLLNYAATASWPGRDRDVVFIPVSFNYDEVPEQARLVFGDSREFKERGKLYLAYTSLRFCLKVLVLPLIPRRNRYGWACASFGDPVSLKSWQRARGIDIKSLSNEERRSQIDALGRQLVHAVTDMIPVLPVHMLSMVLLEHPDKTWTDEALTASVTELRMALEAAGAPIFTYELEEEDACARAIRMMERLGMVTRGGDNSLSAVPSQVPMLQYYANSVSHYLDPVRPGIPADESAIELPPRSDRERNYLTIVFECYDRVQNREIEGKTFFGRFYDIFLASSKQVEEKFRGTDMVRQQVHLQHSLEHMQDFFISGKPSELLKQIAAMHSRSGADIIPGMYDLWLDSLLEAVAEFDREFDTAVDIAWRSVMAPGIAYMRSQYEVDRQNESAGMNRVETRPGVAGEGIARWIDHWGVRSPEKVALIGENRQLTYGEFADEVVRLASALHSRFGIQAGDRVGYLGQNRLEFLTLLFACARLDAILAPINFRLAAEEQQRLIGRADPKVLFLDQEYVDPIAGDSSDFEMILLDSESQGSGVLDYQELQATSGPVIENHGKMSSPLLLMFTSGSTGEPKGALLTQEATHWNALNSKVMHDMKRSDHVVTTLPFFHVGGINIQTLPAFQVGATVSVFSKFDARDFIDFVQKIRPTLTVLVPAQMQQLMKLPDWSSTDMTSLRAVTTGSTIVDKDLIREWANKGVPVIQIYGCTESSPIAVHQTVEGIGPGLGTVGHAALYTEVRVADGSGEPVDAGSEGEILLRGPNIMSHYWRDEAATREAFHDGWLLTGDLGYQDEQGRLRIVGRKKRLIISGGENIHPAEIEQVLEQHSGIKEAAVIGIPDPRWDEVPVAVLVPAEGSGLDENEIRGYLNQHLGRYKHPRHILIVESLPRTALEKIAYQEIGALVEVRLE